MIETGIPAESRDLGCSAALAIVIPTYNECENVGPVLDALNKALAGINWEVIFVDDNSPDGTGDRVRQAACEDQRVRLIQRTGRSGLSSACIEGMLSTLAPYIAVMDGDLQHDESVLPAMLARAKSTGVDVVVASRYARDGGMGQFARRRVWISKLGTRLSRPVCPPEVTDPLSGFFLVRREFFLEVAPRLSGIGFKILLDLLASSTRHVRVAEVPYCFRTRQRGESKLNASISFSYLYMLARQMIRRGLSSPKRSQE